MDRRRDRDGPSDRRPPRGPPRDSDRPPRDRDADRSDRDRRDNHRRDDRDDRNRRYRSRSRDRRDRPRNDRERDGGRSGRGHGREGDRRREHEERPRRRDDDERAPPRRRDGDERGRNFLRRFLGVSCTDATIDHRDKDRRRSASPRRGSASPPPPRQAEGRHAETLPTRGKLGDRGGKEPQQTMSFKVGGARDSPRPDSVRSSEQPEGDARIDEDGDEREEGEQEEDDLEVEGDDAMAAMMGFGGFGTTKNKKIAGNNVGGVRKEKKSEYRQYMNRQGGFNRPLSPGR
ncbi:uncharacterized protein VDAG_08384 [Verticillium dahliae VdLs.17]|uniref:U4/U6.U5 small nuclear ribonucleoprotein 27kDa protein domain-containing protein n=1 Tax=Verticillium dahliae (strain VdLs.17 / ATCC MYA-4575 / FGSC 10137) TaxID=498257 RepID=G2XE02_VERDV|nr:uncharacterized protein VDAG_08384 [Verticillium dahliae VdLs.17]EGY18050.1 hypothetical protein VDAG_08384 [Verticillium dahliae VdLs.17]